MFVLKFLIHLNYYGKLLMYCTVIKPLLPTGVTYLHYGAYPAFIPHCLFAFVSMKSK